ncbi:unnamed protein product [Adineta steineri]|uniref:Uncharacterized protein n=1 Tax=Adineta steineri TaxID=433720 RepID=A0A813NXQ6_9BILA|nr:unnamed protein product [Adineta steineri]CAF3713149.1 unnamed protein product [Adineta steineri]
MYLFIELFLLLLITIISTKSEQRQCQPITYYECKNIGYNQTYLPNKFNHQDQKDVALVINQFTALIAVGCSSELRFLLCSIYMPLCLANYSDSIPPCREVCERVRRPCESFYTRYGFIWPDALKCEQYPSSKENAICMDPRKDEAAKSPSRLPSRSSKSCCQCNTSVGYQLIDEDDYSTIKKCLPPCRSAYFSDEQSISTINIWLTILSILCALSCTFVLLTFFLDMTRFKYPQRPIIFLSLCYFFVSCGYLIRLMLGHENVACKFNNKIDSLSPYTQLVRVSGPSSCAFVFVLTYFFGMASSIWWVILTLTWFLAAGFKWSSEAIAHYSLSYHLIAWLLPCLQTVAILILKGIDGDPISGICYVGHTDSSMLRGFVLLPLISFLTIGTIFLLAGLISLMRIRNVIKIQDRNKTSKLEKLMVRIGLFSILYTVPATFVIGIYFYELRYRSMWEDNLHCNKCPHLSTKSYSTWFIQPSFTIYMLKYFFLLIVGIITGLWINFNSKTFLTWKRFFCCQNNPNNNNNSNNNNNNSDHLHHHHHPYKQHPRYGNQRGRDDFGINYSYKHTKINGSKYSLPSTKQVPLAHV